MDNFYYLGSEIKSIDGVIKGYAVRFGSPNDTDLESDYFTIDTDFGRPLKIGDSFKMNAYYHHGQDKTLKSMVIGEGTVTLDDKGLWYEAQLDMSNEYAAMIDKMIKEGKMGFSSGAAAHLVSREKKSNAYHIKTWCISEISLTPQPAEPRAKVYKSIQEIEEIDKNKDSKKEMEKEDSEEENSEEVEIEVDTNLDPESFVNEIFIDSNKELVSEAIHELFERMCNGLYAVLEQGKPFNYVEALINGFSKRAIEFSNKIYDVPEEEKSALKLYNGSKPETVRDLERRLRDVVKVSNNQAKALAGIVFNQRDVENDTNKKSIEPNNELKNKMIKQAMLDLMR